MVWWMGDGGDGTNDGRAEGAADGATGEGEAGRGGLVEDKKKP